MARTSRKHQPSAEAAAIATKAPVYATWGYTRISRDGEHADDSIEGQTDIITEYAANHADIDLKGFYSDLGFSGTNFDRPSVQELIDGVKSGVVQCVVTKDLSRVGRTHIEVAELLFDTFPKYNVRYISVNDKYDSFADDAGRKKLLVLFKSLINSLFSKDLGKKIRSTCTLKKQKGEPLGVPPYGYLMAKGETTFTIDEEAAAVIRRVFDLRQSGESVSGISRILNREQIPSPQNRLYQLCLRTHEKYAGRIVWHATTISKMLYNEAYIGTLVQGKYDCNGKHKPMLPKEQWIRQPNHHPAIVTLEQFEAVQALMRTVSEAYEDYWNGGSLEPNRYAGLIFCERCGKVTPRMTGGHPDGTTLFYYRCRYCDYDLKQELGLTRSPKLPLTTLDAAVSATLRQQMKLLVDFDKLIVELSQSTEWNAKHKELQREKARLEKAAGVADTALSAAFTHHLDGLLDFKAFELVRAKFESDKRDASERLVKVTDELNKRDLHTTRQNVWLKQFGTFKDFTAPTKELLQSLIKGIYVTPITNELRIELNYMNAFADLRELTVGNDSNDGVGVYDNGDIKSNINEGEVSVYA